jgi:hypothetical protein
MWDDQACAHPDNSIHRGVTRIIILIVVFVVVVAATIRSERRRLSSE